MSGDQQHVEGNDRDPREYLSQVLGMNPLHESDKIVTLRSRMLGFSESNTPAHEFEQQEQRSADLQELQAIRNSFWKDSVESIEARLDKLNVEDFHELQEPVNRLKVVARHRDRIVDFPTNSRFDEDFLRHLKWVLTAAPRDTAALREKLLVAFRNRKNRKQGRPLIARLKAEYPEIYALESAWFAKLANEKSYRIRSREKADRKGSFNFVWVIIAVFALRALVRLLSN